MRWWGFGDLRAHENGSTRVIPDTHSANDGAAPDRMPKQNQRRRWCGAPSAEAARGAGANATLFFFSGNIGSGQHAPTQFKASLGQTLGDVVHSHVKNGRNVFQENKGWLEIVD